MYTVKRYDVYTGESGDMFIKLGDEFKKLTISRKSYPLDLDVVTYKEKKTEEEKPKPGKLIKMTPVEDEKPKTMSEQISEFLEDFKDSELSITKLYNKFKDQGGGSSYSLFYRVYKANRKQ